VEFPDSREVLKLLMGIVRYHFSADWSSAVFLKLGSERRKYVMAEEFYWRSKICQYELKLVWRYSTLIIPSLRTVELGIYCKQRWRGVYLFDF
jgi:hypothetical protein